MNTGPFTPEYAQALRQVDLYIHGATHGLTDNYRELTHPFTIGVNDAGYRQVKSLVESLEPARGDKLAVELRRYTATLPPMLRALNYQLPGEAFTHMGEITRNEVAADLELDAHTFIHNTFKYAVGHAILNGVDVEYADMDAATWQDIQEIQEEMALKFKLNWLPSPVRNQVLRFLFDGPENELREWHMLARLGEIAAGMVPKIRSADVDTEKTRPTLAFLVGRAHLRSLAATLHEHDIPFRTNINPRLYPLLFSAEFAASIFTAESVRQRQLMKKRRREANIL